MRHFILTIGVLLMGFFPAWGQRARYKPQTHEVSLTAGLTQYSPAFDADLQSGLPLSGLPAGGLQYTYHYSLQDGFRLGIQGRRLVFESPSLAQPTSPSRMDFLANLGYERKYHQGPHQWYGGIDVLGARGLADTDQAGLGANFAEFPYFSYGGRAFGGYRYFFSSYVSLAAEVSAQYLIHVYDDKGVEREAFEEYIFADPEASGLLTLRLSFHFANMKKRCTCPKVR